MSREARAALFGCGVGRKKNRLRIDVARLNPGA